MSAKKFVVENIIPRRNAISNISNTIDILNNTRHLVCNLNQKNKIDDVIDVLMDVMMKELSAETRDLEELDIKIFPLGNEEI